MDDLETLARMYRETKIYPRSVPSQLLNMNITAEIALSCSTARNKIYQGGFGGIFGHSESEDHNAQRDQPKTSSPACTVATGYRMEACILTQLPNPQPW